MRRGRVGIIVGVALLAFSLSVSARETDGAEGVLFVLPQGNFAGGDFFPVVTALRAKGVPVTYTSPAGGRVMTTEGRPVIVDLTFDDVVASRFEAVVVPGGFGTFFLLREPRVVEILRAAAEAGVIIGGICAGNDLLVQLGFAEGREVANTPERAEFPPRYGAIPTGEPVWISRPPGCTYTLITALGYPFAVEEFAQLLPEILRSDEREGGVAGSIPSE